MGKRQEDEVNRKYEGNREHETLKEGRKRRNEEGNG
jgi:hypothetical protein